MEDAATVRGMIVNYLKSNGFDTCEAWSVQGASQAIRELQPDIVLLDIILDDGEGYDLVSALAETGTPVMVVSAKDTPLDRILCLELGADDFGEAVRAARIAPAHAPARQAAARRQRPGSGGGRRRWPAACNTARSVST